MHTTRLSRRRALAALGATAPPWLWAQSAMQGRPIDTQGRPITWLVGQPAGGTTDVLTRVVSPPPPHPLHPTLILHNQPPSPRGRRWARKWRRPPSSPGGLWCSWARWRRPCRRPWRDCWPPPEKIPGSLATPPPPTPPTHHLPAAV